MIRNRVWSFKEVTEQTVRLRILNGQFMNSKIIQERGMTTVTKYDIEKIKRA